MHTDHFLEIGRGHKICEDYIISGTNPTPYVILADGCSSSKEVDIGARILCLIAKKYLTIINNSPIEKKILLSYHYIKQWIAFKSAKYIREFSLQNSSLDSTLILLFVDNNTVHVFMYGDGIIMAVGNNDDMWCKEVKFLKNAPHYLSYLLNEDRETAFLKIKENDISITSYESDYPGKLERHFDIRTEHSILHFIFPIDMLDLRAIFISSDGLSSFRSLMGVELPSRQMLKHFLSFKNFKGEFIKRRSKKAIKEINKSHEMFNFDDISIGGIYFGEE
uniref:PPM-type phosphatase domain-containing protein n=1 Tax=viral metagenome TaxID=1070528 RepID=A0A6M3LF00_9ZZZZ